MINTTISISIHYVLNNTEQKWHTYQDEVQEAINNFALHTFPKSSRLISESKEHHESEGCFYEIWGRLKDTVIEISIIKSTEKQLDEEHHEKRTNKGFSSRSYY